MTEYIPPPGPMADLLETIAAAAHRGWMDARLAAGVTSRKAEWGEEFMVPYDQLSEEAKAIDRAAVRSVIDAIQAAGYQIVPWGFKSPCEG